jgi:hypothetical protein
MKPTLVFFAALFFAALIGQPASASSIYFQTQGLPPFGGGGVFSEASGPTTVYDNFTLAATSTISQVSWVGIGSTNPGPPAAGYSFGVNFYSDQGGAPGSLISSNAFQIVGLPYVGLPGYYAYNAPVNVTVGGGQQYWVSIFTYGTSSQWSWDKGFGGDSYSLIFNNLGGGSNVYPHDTAFALIYDPPVTAPIVSSGAPSPVPEPSTLVLSASGLLSLASIIRKRTGA